MSVWSEPRECELCGQQGHPVSVRLVEWSVALPGMRFAHVARCDDRDACRQRVTAKGETWPVVERAA